MKFINRLLLWQKFAVLGVLALVLVGIPFYLYVSKAQEAIDFAKDEQRGIEPTKAMTELFKLLQEHRGLSNLTLTGVASASSQRQAKQAEVERVMAAVETFAKRDQWDAALNKAWELVRNDWKRVTTGVADKTLQPQQSLVAHSQLVRELLAVLETAGDFYKLSLDPEGFTFYMMKAVIFDFSRQTEPLGQLRDIGAGYLARGQLNRGADGKPQAVTEAERLGLLAVLDRAREGLTQMMDSINKAIGYDNTLRGKLESGLRTSREAVNGAIKLTEDQLVNGSAVQQDSAAYFKAYSDAMQDLFAYNLVVTNELDAALVARVKSGQQNTLFVAVIVLALLVLGGLLGTFIVRSVLRPINHLVGVIDKLAQGDSTARAGLNTNDEVGVLAQQFDRMVDEREQAAKKVQAENEQLNTSVLQLLQAVAQLSRKDLTTRVPVAEDVTGPVGDALNMLSAETAKVLQQVNDISADVTAASLKVKEQSDTVVSVAEVEREQVEKTAADLDVAAQAMNRIAGLAQACNVAADNAIKTTQGALATVSATVGGINGIRETIRETEKRIKRLGERSQEISGVVNLINTIAERTHILALNASMHAASAGEAGRGFAVVADEVQRLAENARQATGQIATLVNNIQVETADTVTTMNNTISQVVEGSKLAEQAGEQMKRTQETTAELVASVQQIAESSNEQARMSNELLNRAGEIRKSTQLTSEQLRQQTAQTENLVEYARLLLGAVRVFKLPG